MESCMDRFFDSLESIRKDGFTADNLAAGLPLIMVAVAAAVLINYIVFKLFPGSRRPLLNPSGYVDVTVTVKEQLTHNTYLFRLGFPDRTQPFGLPIGQHVRFKLLDNDHQEVLRSYTPVSDVDQLGYADFVIKIYPTGKMTQLLHKLNVGDKISLQGPRGRFKYQPNMKKTLGMIAGGTGITPMFQVMSAVFKNAQDITSVNLLCGNVTVEDVLLKNELDLLLKQQPSRLSVYHVLNNPPDGWQGGAGFITVDMIKAQLPPPSSDVLVLLCGPTPMLKAMNNHLHALGYTDDIIFMF